MMKNKKIRVGIIGANTTNWASKSHISALKLLPEFELTAVSTTRMSTAQEASDRFGAQHAFDNESDLHKLLGRIYEKAAGGKKYH